MARRIKGITIELGGETRGLEQALKSVNQRSRDLQKELRDVERLLKFNPGNTELIAQKQKLLGEQVENTAEKLNQLRNAQQEVQQQFEKGEIDASQYRAFQREIADTEGRLARLEEQLQDTQQEARNFGETIQNAGTKMRDFGGMMSAAVTAPLIGGLIAVTKGTEDYRQQLAKLEQNARQAGITTQFVKDQLTLLSGVSADTEMNIEALSNLMASGFDKQGLTAAVNALSGAVIRFPETLSINELANGLQETIATGEAAGQFAELLARLGVNTEKFNKELKNAVKNGQAQNFVLQTLADTGLAKVNQQYRKNNQELVKSRQSAENFQQAMAKLGESLSPIVTKATNFITKLVNKFNELNPTIKKVITIVLGLIGVLGPLITIAGAVAIAISAISASVWLIIGAIAALIAIGVALWLNWETVKKKAKKIWGSIKNFFIKTWNAITDAFQSAGDAIINSVSHTWNWVENKIKLVLSSVWGRVSSWIHSIRRGFSNMVDGIQSALSNLWDILTSPFRRAYNWIRRIPGMIADLFRNLRIDIPTPHFDFNVNWRDLPGPLPSVPVPNVDIDWYKTGGVFSKPTVIGVGDASTPEIVAPEKMLRDIFTDVLQHYGALGEITIEIPLDGEVIARKTVRYTKQELDRMKAREMRARGEI